MRLAASKTTAILVVLVVCSVAAHGSGLAGGFTNWDDATFLLRNPLVASPLADGWLALATTPHLGYPIPLTVLAYAAQWTVFASEPLGYHAVSLFAHVIVVLLAFALARRLGVSKLAAAGAAAVFAAHPLTVEPVAWVVGQKDLWATSLLMMALVVRAGPRGEGGRAATVAAILCLLALAAKPSAVVAPALLLAVDVALSRRWSKRGNLALYGIAGGFAIVVTILAVVGHSGIAAPVHADGQSVIGAGWAFSLQLWHLLVPDGLAARYFPPQGGRLIVLAALGWFAALVIAWLVLHSWRRGRRALAFSLAAAVISYAPASGLVAISRGPADSYLYLPMALLVVALGAALEEAASWPRRRVRIATGVAVAVACLALLSSSQSRVWADSISLWREVQRRYPDHPVANTRVGNAMMFAGDFDGASSVLATVVERWPAHAPAWQDLGVAYDALGQKSNAERAFAEAAERGGNALFRETYAFFLAGHPRLPASKPRVAETALLELAPVLIERGKRSSTLMGAALRLHDYGHEQLARELRRRASRARWR